ncbi:MAG: glycosyltransferase family 4 protein [Candidatus Bathyarchaeia archaeon]
MPRRRLCILQISSHFYPKVDGTVRSIDELLQGLSKRQHSVFLITRKMPNTPTISNHKGVKVIRVGPLGRSFFQRVLLGINQAFTAIRLFRRERIDLVDTHGFSSMVTGFLIKKIHKAPLIFTFHGFPRLWVKDFRWRKWYEHFFSYPFERWLLGKADIIIVRSHLFAKMVTSVYGSKFREKIEVIPHGVDTELFKYKPPRMDDAPTILFVGTLSKVHGAPLLIRAAPLILRDFPKASFIIVGDGPLKPTLEKLVQDLNIDSSVTFVGLVRDREKLVQHYQNASVVVIPLEYKGYILSLVAVEALSTGRPVVTTMQLDPKLKDVGVFFIKEYTPEELAKTVKHVLFDDQEHIKALSIAGRKFIEKLHSEEVYLSKVEAVYLKLIKASANNA